MIFGIIMCLVGALLSGINNEVYKKDASRLGSTLLPLVMTVLILMMIHPMLNGYTVLLCIVCVIFFALGKIIGIQTNDAIGE